MISEELKTIIGTLHLRGQLKVQEAATEDQITNFEQEHGIVFPAQYREWLLFSDGGECFLPAGIQLYGVAHKPVICVANDDRPNENYVVIGALATGDPILCEKGSDKISIYNHEDSRIEADEVYDCFFDFLSDLDELLGIGG